MTGIFDLYIIWTTFVTWNHVWHDTFVTGYTCDKDTNIPYEYEYENYYKKMCK